MSNEARKARKKAGEKYQPKPPKVPTGYLGKGSMRLPTPLSREDLALAMSVARKAYASQGGPLPEWMREY